MLKQKKAINIIISFCMIMIFLTGQFPQGTTIAEAAAKKLTLNLTKLTLQVGESKNLSATASSNKGGSTKIKWTSANKKIATVSSTGKIKAVSAGTVVIKATLSKKITATCKVTVKEKKIAVKKIVLNILGVKGHVGNGQIIEATVIPSNAPATISWSSSNKKVASVDKNGGVAFLSEGTAVITAKSQNGIKATCNVTVWPDVPEDTDQTANDAEASGENPVDNTDSGEEVLEEDQISQDDDDNGYSQDDYDWAEETDESSGDASNSEPVNYDTSLFASRVLEIVNEERSKEGLSPLSTNSAIQEAADIRAAELASSYSHGRPNGTSWNTALEEANITYRSAGENICYGYNTPEQAMNAWLNSPGHRANILKSSYNQIGIGVYQSGGVLYWSQLFTD